MLKVLATMLGVGIVATAVIANAQMQMPQGQMPMRMQMGMGEHPQMQMDMTNHMAAHAEMHGQAQMGPDHARMGAGEATPGQMAALPPGNAVAPVPVNGEVVRIDEETGRVTLRHEPIPNLDMRAMTMVFRTENPSLLAGLKVGDRVTFEAERVGGAITVTKLDKAATN